LQEVPVSFLALATEDASFCLLTKYGKVLTYKFKFIESQSAYQQHLFDQYLKESEKKIRAEKLEMSQQQTRDLRDRLRQKAKEESSIFKAAKIIITDVQTVDVAEKIAQMDEESRGKFRREKTQFMQLGFVSA
jgi:hypothetical protein